ncbi:hypothetical protein B7463_g4475, partial [Scytalidium lignicola]
MGAERARDKTLKLNCFSDHKDLLDLFEATAHQQAQSPSRTYITSEQYGVRKVTRVLTLQFTAAPFTATVGGRKGDGMILDMQIRDSIGNEYGKAKDVVGEKRMAFTSLADASFDVCFENYFASSQGGRGIRDPTRYIELDIDIGADAKDWSAVQATEKLKPVETELRRIEEMVSEIVAEMDYLRTREQKLRDTNESTNTRVKWFAFSTMGMLVALGAWQVIYLRAYFRSKHLI